MKPATLALLLLLGLNTMLRFTGVEQAPPGYFSDEARGSAHALCIGEDGRDLAGQLLPAFSPTGRTRADSYVGGFYTAPWTFSGALWSKAFGPSRGSFRSLAVTHSIGALIFLFLIAQMFWGTTVGLVAAVVYAYMPASFHLARIAWDVAILPFYLLGGTYFFLRGGRGFLVASGFFFAMAALLYPAPRIQLLGLIPALVWFRWPRIKVKELVYFVFSFLVFSAPVFEGLASGYLLTRYNDTTIFDSEYLRTFSPGEFSYAKAALAALVWKLHAQFGPLFLFFSGDGNLRHSTQFVGELGSLEILALLFASVLLVKHLLYPRKGAPTPLSSPFNRDLQIVFAIAIFFGCLPSVLTKEGPHALRSTGMFPFIALWCTLLLMDALGRARRQQGLLFGTIVVAFAVYSVYFFESYFRRYPGVSQAAFQVEVLQKAKVAATQGELQAFVQEPTKESERTARAYFALAAKATDCKTIRRWIWPE